MKICPNCHKTWDDQWGLCKSCNNKLEHVDSEAEARLICLEAQAKQILKEVEQIRTTGLPQNKSIDLRVQGTPKPPKPIQPIPKPVKKEDTETQIGKYVLNKIGIISLVGGIAFLIAYTFKYLQPIHKITIGYIASVAMLFLGSKTEKRERFRLYGRALIGGGWSLIYFTTFAMYHIPATRIIQSQLLDLFLMAVVVALMVRYLFKYRSQTIMTLTLFLGYLTAGISGITSFSLIYITLLAVGSVFFIYKENWQRLGFFSLLGTYITYFILIKPYLFLAKTPQKIDTEWFWIAIGFLSVYWFIYNLIPFLIKISNNDDKKSVNAFILVNSVIFGVVGAFVTHLYNTDWRFGFGIAASFTLAAIACYAKYIAKKSEISTIFIITSIAFASASLPAKLKYDAVNIIWLLEIPILIYIGTRLKKISFRIAAWTLSGLMVYRMFSYLALSFYVPNVAKTMFVFMGRDISDRLLVVFIGCICFYLAKVICQKLKDNIKKNELLLISNSFSYIGTGFLLAILFFEVQKNLVTVTWTITTLVLFSVGFLMRDKHIRYAAMVVVGCAIARIIFVDMSGLLTLHRILVCISLGIVLLIASYSYTKMASLLKDGGEYDARLQFKTAASILIATPMIVVLFALAFPSETRKEEIAYQKEAQISDKLLDSKKLTTDEVGYLNSRNFKYFIDKARYYSDDKKVAMYELALSLGAKSSEVYGGLGDYYNKHGQMDKSIVMYKKAVEADPKLREWRTKEYATKLAGLYLSAGDYPTALIYYERCLKRHNYDVSSRFNLALCKVHMGKADEALQDINTALSMNPSGKLLAKIYYLMGHIYEEKGMLDTAKQKYMQSVNIDPSNEEAKSGLRNTEKQISKREGVL